MTNIVMGLSNTYRFHGEVEGVLVRVWCQSGDEAEECGVSVQEVRQREEGGRAVAAGGDVHDAAPRALPVAEARVLRR